MEPKYTTLRTIYEIVKNETNPATYNCSLRQIILRQMQPWDNIMQHLEDLAEEGFISIQKPAAIVCITEKGIEQAKSVSSITPK